MPFQEQGWTRRRADFLMDVTATLCQHTQETRDFDKIPGYLSHEFQVEAISLAIVQEVQDGTHVLVGTRSGSKAGDSFEQDLLALYQQVRALNAKEGPALRSGHETDVEVTEVPVQFQAEYPRATVFS